MRSDAVILFFDDIVVTILNNQIVSSPGLGELSEWVLQCFRGVKGVLMNHLKGGATSIMGSSGEDKLLLSCQWDATKS